MAVASASTTAPARPLLPRRDVRGRFVKLASVVPANDTPELPPEPLLPADVRHGGAGLLKFEDTLSQPVQNRPADRPEHFRPVSNYTGNSGVVADTAERTGRSERAVQRDAARAEALGADLKRVSGTSLDTGVALVDMADVRRALEALIAEAEAREPQTARSSAMGPAWADLADVVDLASLAAGQRCHAYRMAADAVDHLIALMDALEADTEDMEDDDPGGTDLDLGEGDDADCEPSLGAPERHPYVRSMTGAYYWPANGSYYRAKRWCSQASWAQGERRDGEGEAEVGYDLPEGDDERCGSEHDGREMGADTEPLLGWPEDVGAVMSAETCLLAADSDAEHDDVDREDDELGDDHDPEPLAWVFGPSRCEVAHV